MSLEEEVYNVYVGYDPFSPVNGLCFASRPDSSASAIAPLSLEPEDIDALNELLKNTKLVFPSAAIGYS